MNERKRVSKKIILAKMIRGDDNYVPVAKFPKAKKTEVQRAPHLTNAAYDRKPPPPPSRKRPSIKGGFDKGRFVTIVYFDAVKSNLGSRIFRFESIFCPCGFRRINFSIKIEDANRLKGGPISRWSPAKSDRQRLAGLACAASGDKVGVKKCAKKVVGIGIGRAFDDKHSAAESQKTSPNLEFSHA